MGAPLTMVLSYGAWKQQFSGDSSVIGRRLNSPYYPNPLTVIGVAPPGLDYPAGVEAWAAMAPLGGGMMNVVGRLASGANPESAGAELLQFMARDGRTILISSHQLTDLERFADHAAIMNHGQLLTSGRMDKLVERYRQFDARVVRDTLLSVPGVSVIDRQGDRVRLLVDQDDASPTAIEALQLEVLAQVPLTLEELFLALIKSADRRRGRWPHMSAA